MNVHMTQKVLHYLDEHLAGLVPILAGAIIGKPVDEHVRLRFKLPGKPELADIH